MKSTKKMPGKDHEMAIKIAEGLKMGSVHPAHTKMKPMNAKINSGVQKKARAMNVKRENGSADRS